MDEDSCDGRLLTQLHVFQKNNWSQLVNNYDGVLCLMVSLLCFLESDLEFVRFLPLIHAGCG